MAPSAAEIVEELSLFCQRHDIRATATAARSNRMATLVDLACIIGSVVARSGQPLGVDVGKDLITALGVMCERQKSKGLAQLPSGVQLSAMVDLTAQASSPLQSLVRRAQCSAPSSPRAPATPPHTACLGPNSSGGEGQYPGGLPQHLWGALQTLWAGLPEPLKQSAPSLAVALGSMLLGSPVGLLGRGVAGYLTGQSERPVAAVLSALTPPEAETLAEAFETALQSVHIPDVEVALAAMSCDPQVEATAFEVVQNFVLSKKGLTVPQTQVDLFFAGLAERLQ